MSARVSWIAFAPVKSTALQHVEEIDLLESGPRGDRRFYFVGERGRLVNDEDFPQLQLVHAEHQDDELSLRFADGRVISGTVEHGDDVETTFHKRPRTARLVVGPWAEAVSEL